MKTGITNAKGKGGGYDLPIITIGQSQMVDSSNFTPTAEQYQLIVDNAYKQIVVELNGTPLLMNIGFGNNSGEYRLSSFTYDNDTPQITINGIYIKDSGGVLNGEIYFDNFEKSSGGGTATTLYQHNVYVKGSVMINGYDRYFRGWITIINDSNLPFVKGVEYVEGTNVDIMAWLYNNGYDATSLNKSYPANMPTTAREYFGIGIGSDGTYLKLWEVGENTFQLGNTTVNDDVITL